MIKTLAAALLLAGFATAAHAVIPGNTVTIGVLTDMNAGNADATGQGSVVAAQLAVEDAKKFLPGVKSDVINADHQNKADLAASIAREWVSEGVNVIADVPFSSAGLAVSEATRNAPRSIFIASGTGTSDLTGKVCSPNTVHWTYDTYATGNAVARALIGQGPKTWFFITADYAFGAAL
jgi:branched-chain amino acid transport system substrate-binding protein